MSKDKSIKNLSKAFLYLLQCEANVAGIVDVAGKIHYNYSVDPTCKITEDSIFYLLQDFSLHAWKSTWNTMIGQGEIEFETMVSLPGKIDDAKAKIKLLPLEDDLAIFIYPRPKAANSQPSKENQNLGESFNYDMHAPHMVFYTDSAGYIIYKNPVMSSKFKDIDENLHVDTLFLDTDLGAPFESWLNADISCETVIEMVMKTPDGYIKGYARITKHDENPNAKRLFRVEFLNQKDLRYFGTPVEGMVGEIEKLSDDLEFHKELLIEEAIDGFDFDHIVTQSPVYKEILAMAAQVADTNSTVLITGETGTGKELLCNSIFRLSDRSDKVLVKINCGSIPSELMESVLFGHEKGAFTGADKQKIGKFELADKGTIFLDEIGELPLHLQPKLLRALQEGEIERVGNPMPIKVNVRIIAATNRDLELMVKNGDFRADLFYRLNVFPIYNIPLRERKEDLPILIKHFIRKSNKKTGRNVINISKKDYNYLMRYDYPGNIRELENIIERGVILTKNDTIELGFLNKPSTLSSKSSIVTSYQEMQKKYFSELLSMTKGKVSGSESASEIAQINNKTLTSKLKKLGIDPKAFTNG